MQAAERQRRAIQLAQTIVAHFPTREQFVEQVKQTMRAGERSASVMFSGRVEQRSAGLFYPGGVYHDRLAMQDPTHVQTHLLAAVKHKYGDEGEWQIETAERAPDADHPTSMSSNSRSRGTRFGPVTSQGTCFLHPRIGPGVASCELMLVLVGNRLHACLLLTRCSDTLATPLHSTQ